MMITPLLRTSLVLLIACLQVSCSLFKKDVAYVSGPDTAPRAVIEDGIAITLRDQKLSLFEEGKLVEEYPISSSKFGIGAQYGSHRTPTGIHAVSSKLGTGQPEGMVFKSGRPTGEIVDVNAQGRDPIVTRVIQLSGLEKSNRNSYVRRIYLHGTPEERYIGVPASYGCIRMRSDDIVDLYARIHRGTPVAIETCSQKSYLASMKQADTLRIAVPKTVVAKLPANRAHNRVVVVPKKRRRG